VLANVGAQRFDPGPVGGGAARLPAAADEHARAARSGSADQLVREPALPDAGLATDEEQTAPPRKGVVETGEELGELSVPADEGSSAAVHLGDGLDEVEQRVLVQNRELELAQLSPRLDPELIHEPCAEVGVGGERVDVAARAVEGEHLLAAQALPERLCADKRVKLADQLDVSAGGELLLHVLLEAGEPQFLQARRVALQRPKGSKLGERRPAPQGERLLEPPILLELLEPGQVELVVVDAEQIPGRLRLHALPADELAQL
jgi:hypothetical protein